MSSSTTMYGRKWGVMIVALVVAIVLVLAAGLHAMSSGRGAETARSSWSAQTSTASTPFHRGATPLRSSWS